MEQSFTEEKVTTRPRGMEAGERVRAMTDTAWGNNYPVRQPVERAEPPDVRLLPGRAGCRPADRGGGQAG